MPSTRKTGTEMSSGAETRGPDRPDPQRRRTWSDRRGPSPHPRSEMSTSAAATPPVRSIRPTALKRLIARICRCEESEFVLQIVQPSLVGMIDGTVSTLAPIFAAAVSSSSRTALLVGLATALGAGVSMGFSEALSDTGEQTGRGSAIVRGAITGAATDPRRRLSLAAVHHHQRQPGAGGSGDRRCDRTGRDRLGATQVPARHAALLAARRHARRGDRAGDRRRDRKRLTTIAHRYSRASQRGPFDGD